MTEGAKTPPKVGLFLWDPGGRLAAGIDIDMLVRRATRMKNVARCDVITDIWSTGFLASVKADIDAGTLNRLVWVGRFSAVQEKVLESGLEAGGFNRFLHEWCDLEEQGVGRQGADRALQTQKAAILVQMSVARARLLEALEPVSLPAIDAACIIGAGVAGLHAASSLLKLGKKVYLIEKESGVGGKVASLHRLYPRICDPACGLEFEVEKLKGSERVEVHTLSRVKAVDGTPGNFEVRIEKRPRCVSVEKCNGCGACAEVCPVALSGDGQDPPLAPSPGLFGPGKKAIHPPVPMGFPSAFAVERQYCPAGCGACVGACPTGAIDLDEAPSELVVHAGALIVTTGWDPYPLSTVEEYGYGVYPNVVSNLDAERLLDDLPEPREVGFIQCAGSRDERHLSYCSSVCCSASLKQVVSLKGRCPDARVYLFYQDIRTPGFDEALYQQVKSLDGVIFIRGLPSAVKPDGEGKLKVRAEDVLSGKEVSLSLDLLVLAGGMVPSRDSGETAEPPRSSTERFRVL